MPFIKNAKSRPSPPDRDTEITEDSPICDVENREEFQEGGIYPVEIGDIINDFEILRKLSQGKNSTVWLARHMLPNRFVAVKIRKVEMNNGDRMPNDEAFVLKQIKELFPKDIGHEHIVDIRGAFRVKGPNGIHSGIAYELMQGNVSMRASDVKHSESSIKLLCVHALRGLALIHRSGYIHCDFDFDNILFDTNHLDSYDEAQMKSYFPPPEHIEHSRVDGNDSHPHAPNRQYPGTNEGEISQGPKDFTIYNENELVFKIAGLGRAIPDGEQPRCFVQPWTVRPPEQIFGFTWDQKLDVWALGCCVFQTVTGFSLFEDPVGADNEDVELHCHLGQLIKRLGPLPFDMRKQWLRADDFVGENGYLLVESRFSRGLPLPSCIFQVKKSRPGETDFDFENGDHGTIFSKMDPGQQGLFIDFLMKMLRWSPQERATADELLEHPWLYDAGQSNSRSRSGSPLQPMEIMEVTETAKPKKKTLLRKLGKWILPLGPKNYKKLKS